MAGQPETPMRSASRWSWWEAPTVASITRSAMSARSSASRARSTAWCSVPRSVLDGRRRPAVSMKHTGPSGVSTTVSMASRVVPGMSCTMERSSPRSRLKSVDLPTFGRPTMATRGSRIGALGQAGLASAPARPCRPPSLGDGSAADDLVEEVTGAPPVQGADRERVAHPQRDELPGGRLPVLVVDLVHDQAHRRAGRCRMTLAAAQVLLGDPVVDVDHHQHDVGLGERPARPARSPWRRARRPAASQPRCP